MSKPIHPLKQYTSGEIYEAYVQKLLKENPTWWPKYEKKLKRKNCYIYAKENGKVVLKMSWLLWKEVIERYFHAAKYSIIAGETFRLGNNLGKIRGARIERDFSKPRIDWPATFKEGIKDENGRFVKIFRTDEDYCRIEWVKCGMITNESCYIFTPAGKNTVANTGLKVEFSKALINDPLLKYKLKFYPIKKNRYAIPIHES